jgi:hypothetical protein
MKHGLKPAAAAVVDLVAAAVVSAALVAVAVVAAGLAEAAVVVAAAVAEAIAAVVVAADANTKFRVWQKDAGFRPASLLYLKLDLHELNSWFVRNDAGFVSHV